MLNMDGGANDLAPESSVLAVQRRSTFGVVGTMYWFEGPTALAHHAGGDRRVTG